VLNELNEVEITSGVTTARGVQKFIGKAVNKAINDIYNSEMEWPFAYSAGSQALTAGTQEYSLPSDYRYIDWDSCYLTPTDLVTNGAFTSAITSWTDVSAGTGTAAYTSTGNGRARLAGGSSGTGGLEQSLATVSGSTYRVKFRTFTGTIAVTVGTATGLSDITSSTDYTVDNVGDGQFHEFEFAATSAASFIGFRNTTNANHDVDFVEVKFNISPVKLQYVDLEEWENTSKADEDQQEAGSYSTPTQVYATRDDKMGVSDIPNRSDLTVEFDYWATHTDMSADSSTHSIPARFEFVIKERVLYYAYRFRQDMIAAKDSKDNYDIGVEKMRTEIINKPTSFRSRTGGI
jgi:hypothetical protein